MRKHIKKITALILTASFFTSFIMNSTAKMLPDGKPIYMSVEAAENDLGEEVQEGITEDGMTYLYNSEKVVITGYEGTSPDLIIPEYIDDKPVTAIAGKAFYNNKVIQNIEIEAKISEIPENCFVSSTLESIKLPDTLKIINEWGLSCSTLKECNLPDGLKEMYEGALAGTQIERAEIPDTVDYIAPNVFMICQKLEYVKLPDSVETIYFNTFGSCYSLTNIQLPSKLIEIKESAFEKCTSLRQIILPDGIRTINPEAFKGCCKLSDIYIPESISELDDNVFSDCFFLSIYGKNGSYAEQFANDHGYEFISDENEIQSKEIKSGETELFNYIAYKNDAVITDYKGNLTKLIIPETIDGYNIIKIADSLFSGNEVIEEVDIKANITKLPVFTFEHCYSLKKVVLPGCLKTIEDYSLSDCCNLSEIVIPDTLQIIGDSAFSFCPSLNEVTFPDSLTSIGSGAFQYSGIIDISLPDSVSFLGEFAFNECEELRSVRLSENLSNIPLSAFGNCGNLSQIIIPDSVEIIYTKAFESCTKLSAVYIPENVIQIDEGAFSDCHFITIYGQSDSFAKDYAQSNGIPFDEDNEFSTPDINDGSNQNFKYAYSDNQCVITEYLGEDWDVIVPYEIDGHKVTGLSSSVFHLSDLKNIKIEAELNKLSAKSFESCYNLESCILPESLTRIEYEAFEYCSSLKEIDIPDSVKVIERNAFDGCSSLSRIHLPESLTEISFAMFISCSSLEQIDIPLNVTSINESAFRYCSSLKKINMPDTVEYLGPYILAECPLVEHINIPSDINNINYLAFAQCTGLKNIIIPDNIREIGYNAFLDCEKLTGVYIPETVQYIDDTAFENCYFLVISAPKGSYTIEYAKAHNIRYVEITENSDNEGFEAGIGAEVIENLDDSQELPVFSNNGSAVFDSSSVIEIKHRHGNKDISFSYNVVKNSKDETMSEAASEVIENGGKLLDFDLTDTDGNKVEFNSQNNDGTVTITVPYTKPVSANEVWVYYIAPDGTKTDMNGVYDPSAKTITFTTTHFSYYSIESDGDVKITYDKYDVNKDGAVNVSDAVSLQNFLLAKPNDCCESADINSDGMVNVFDLTMLKRKILSI